MSRSYLERLALDPNREALLSELTAEQAALLRTSWLFNARPEQRTPNGDWFVWLLLAGRGFGKTKTGSEWVREQVYSGTKRFHLVSRTAADVRDVMVEGESGVLNVFPEHERPIYEPSKRRVTFHTGAIATCFSGDEPDQLRGPQCEAAWCDELAAWKYADEAWSNLLMGLRLGDRPRVVVTTTPRPIKLIRELLKEPTTVTTRGSTFDNAANLAAQTLRVLRQRYEGTSRGQQELYAAILDESPGALWKRRAFEDRRVQVYPTNLRRIVVAIDPSASSEGNEAGIVVAGIGHDRRGYVLADRSVRGSPATWAKRAVDAFHEFKADRIVAEKNQGGEMVSHTIRTVGPDVPIKLVTASRGKATRAEPIAALYEQGRVSHLGAHRELEDQCCTWDPVEDAESPDRLDALVWALTELMLDAQPIIVSVGGYSAPSPNKL